MFSNWFSGDDLEHYRASPHKQRIDAIASSLLRLQYPSEVIRQHLHEWLRFSLSLATEERALPAPNAETVRQYVAQRVSEWRAAAPADPAFFGPPSGSFWRQMSKGAFAVAFAARLLPRRGSTRF